MLFVGSTMCSKTDEIGKPTEVENKLFNAEIDRQRNRKTDEIETKILR